MSITEHKETHLVEEGQGIYTLAGSATLEQLSTLLRLEYQKKLPGRELPSPDCARRFLEPILSALAVKEFIAIWLDAQNRVLGVETLFSGTVNELVVYPREVLKRAVGINAAAVMFAHNCHSGDTTPSLDNKNLTKKLVSVLEIVDVQVLDHFIVGIDDSFSYAERGMI